VITNAEWERNAAMSLSSRLTVLLALVAQVPLGTRLFANADSQIAIEGPHRAVKGFPIILRVTTTGPMVVPMADICHTLEDLSVTFTPLGGGGPYEIQSNRSMEFDLSLPGDGPGQDGADLANRRIGEVERMVFFFDVASLRSFGKGARFADISPGRYRLTITFSLSKVTSATHAIELIEATAEDQAFLDDVMMSKDRVALQRSPSRSRRPILWPELIAASKLWEMPLSQIQKLSSFASAQVQLHALLYQVNRGAITQAEALNHPVPQYLEAERNWRLLECRLERGTDDARAAMREFADEHPGFAWRLNETVP
jgi:hypothetical protein